MDKEIELALAEAGVPLLPEYPVASGAPVAKNGDLTMYSVAGLLFRTMEDAREVADTIIDSGPLIAAYAPGGHFTQKIAKRDDAAGDIEIVRVFSEELWASIREGEEKAERKRKAHASRLAEYERIRKFQKEIVGRIIAERDAAEAVKRLDDQREEMFLRYLALAVDADQAMTFMLEACEDAGLGTRDELTFWLRAR